MDRLIARVLRTRWAVRALIPVLRLRLGWLLGGRVLLLEHRGRVSGERRFVALERVDESPVGVAVASGFGTSAQWYRNLRANGVAYVTQGSHAPRRASPRFLDPTESRHALKGLRSGSPLGLETSAGRDLRDPRRIRPRHPARRARMEGGGTALGWSGPANSEGGR